MDRYRAAVDLYTCSIRALEQRSMAFFIVQSLLAASYAALFGRVVQNSDATILMLGVALIGIAFCLLSYVAGRTVSQDAWIWMKCAQSIEERHEEGLWSCFREEASRFWLQKECTDRLPGPTLWLFSPALFLTAWLCTIVALYGLHYGWYIGVVVVVGGLTFFVYKKHTKTERSKE